MARYNLGWTGAVRNSIPEKLNLSSNIPSEGKQIVFFGVVTEPILDESFPQGSISYTSTQNKTPGKASPFFSNITQHPISGEVVLIFSFTDTEYNKNGVSSPFNEDNPNSRNFYISGLNIWDNPSFNGVASSPQINDSSNPSYFNPEGGARSLQSFIGDYIVEGRFGNSIRLGGSYNTPWESSKNNSPIIILNNGSPSSTQTINGIQPISGPSISIEKYAVENLKTDLSSIYLTSDQKIKFSLANENFTSYSTPPITPSLFSSPQIILNSNRIILNAKKDSILISGEKSIGLSSNQSINLEAKQIYIDGNDIRLGNKLATQPVLLGNDAVRLIKIITKELLNISTILKNSQIYPGGVPSPDPLMNPVASIASNNLHNVLAQLDSIKSNFVKTI